MNANCRPQECGRAEFPDDLSVNPTTACPHNCFFFNLAIIGISSWDVFGCTGLISFRVRASYLCRKYKCKEANPQLHLRGRQIPKFRRSNHVAFWAANFLEFWSLNGIFLFSADFACMEPLGMESWEITSEQITASSQYNPSWSPERSRLNYPENGWTPSDDTVREWIQVSGSSPASRRVNNGTTPRGSSSPSLSSEFGVCSEVSALQLGASKPRCCSHLAWILFISFVRLLCKSRGPRRKETQISQHAILTSRFSLDSFFLLFFSTYCKMWHSRELGLDTRERSL